MNAPVSFPKALWRGFTMKCPNCGQGHLFGRFLKVVDSCEVCGEDYTPQRADDLPAYLVIAVVGHLVVPVLLAVEMAYSPPVWLQLLIWVPVTGLAALFLLQPVKGAIVGLQWQTGMHGFEAAKRCRDQETLDHAAPLPNVVSNAIICHEAGGRWHAVWSWCIPGGSSERMGPRGGCEKQPDEDGDGEVTRHRRALRDAR